MGSEWVMALFRIKEDVPGGFNPPPRTSAMVGWEITACPVAAVTGSSRSGDWVTGNLAQAPRWVREPKMTPVLLDLLADYVAGKAGCAGPAGTPVARTRPRGS